MADQEQLKKTGVIKSIMPVVTGQSAKGEWKKQEFVITTQEDYPVDICFTLFNDKLSLIDGIGEGQTVTVWFNLQSREYSGKHYHNVNAWKIDTQAKEKPSFDPTLGSEKSANALPSGEELNPKSNDLPF